MRLFSLLGTQHLILGIFLGSVCSILIYLGFRSAGIAKPRKQRKRESGYPDGLQIENHSLPPLLIFLLLGFVAWLIFYVIFFGLEGKPL
jgi:hypothetical protein